MGLILLPLFTFLFFTSVDGYCSGGTKTASTYLKTLSHLYYSNNEDCTFYINPQYSSGYYLEIKWVTFSVEGSLPSCSYDSVEVYLTRYEILPSIRAPVICGRFELMGNFTALYSV